MVPVGATAAVPKLAPGRGDLRLPSPHSRCGFPNNGESIKLLSLPEVSPKAVVRFRTVSRTPHGLSDSTVCLSSSYSVHLKG